MMQSTRILALVVMALIASQPLSAEVDFDRHEIVTGTAQQQTILIGHFMGGAMAEVAVIYPHGQGNRKLHIYRFQDDDWALVLNTSLGNEVLFADVLKTNGRDRLIVYQQGRVSVFETASGSLDTLVEVDIDYNRSEKGQSYAGTEPLYPSGNRAIPHIDITRDLNHDGLDDLVLPSVEGFWIATQGEDGSFARPVKLGPPEPFRDANAFDDTRNYGEVGISALTIPWYLSRVHELDYDMDGRNDLAFWNDDHFEVYRQGVDGAFATVAETITTKAPFESDGTYSILFGLVEAGESSASLLFGLRKRSRMTVLVSLRDMNGDQVADLTTMTLEGRGILKLASHYMVYFGTRTPDGVAFPGQPDTSTEPSGRAGGMHHSGYSSLWLQDFDGDGQLEIMVGEVKIGLTTMLRAMLGTTITLTGEIHRLEDGSFPERPVFKQNIKCDIEHGGRDQGFFPAMVVGDVNGDGRTDVLVGKNRQELYIYLGEPGPGVLSKKARKFSATLPSDERNTWLADINGDASQDIVLQHPANTEPGRVTLLVSR